MCGRNQNFDVSMTNFIDGRLPLTPLWCPGNLFLQWDRGVFWIRSASGPGPCRSVSGAPLMSSKGISVWEPESEAGLLRVPELWSS